MTPVSPIASREARRAADRIERRVLDEMWLSPRGRLGLAMLSAALAGAVVVWSSQLAGPAQGPSSMVADAMLGLAAFCSAAAVGVRRFRWCCAAAYTCGLGAVSGFGAFWLLRTGAGELPVAMPAVAGGLAAVSCVRWVAVIATPLQASQPDMRSAVYGIGPNTS